jgi:hypothetical protein
LRIANVSQPWTQARPPSESVAIVTEAMARRLAGRHDIVIYSKGNESGVESHDGTTYRLLRGRGDHRIAQALKLRPSWRSRRYPDFASPFYHLGYHRDVARSLRADRAEIAHIHNFSQLLPLIRLSSPQAATVLEMHCDWLAQLDFRMLARRLRHADSIVGPTEHVTDAVRRRFPDLA